MRVTPARLTTWLDCPRRYRMTYVDRPTPSRGGPWAHSTLGAVVHVVLRELFDLPPERRTAERAVVLLRRHWKNDGFADPAQAAEYRRRAEQWLTSYVNQLDPDVRTVAVERWVSVSSGTIIAEGRVDRVDQRGDELVVVDYKTGRRDLTDADARNSLALALYVLAVRGTFHRPAHRVELHHLPTGRVLAWEHTEQTLNEHRQYAERVAGEFQDATDAVEERSGDVDELFPPRTGWHCSSCEFRAHCPEGRQAAPDLPPWSLLRA